MKSPSIEQSEKWKETKSLFKMNDCLWKNDNCMFSLLINLSQRVLSLVLEYSSMT
jgi:hypothetical protein